MQLCNHSASTSWLNLDAHIQAKVNHDYRSKTDTYRQECMAIIERITKATLTEQGVQSADDLRLLITDQHIDHPHRHTVNIMHSCGVYWDIILPKSAFDKYKRPEHSALSRNTCLYSNFAQRVYCQDNSLVNDIFNEVTPFLNLISQEAFYACDTQSSTGSRYSDDGIENPEVLKFLLWMARLLTAMYDCMHSYHFVIFSLSALCVGPIIALCLTSLIIVCQALYTMYTTPHVTEIDPVRTPSEASTSLCPTPVGKPSHDNQHDNGEDDAPVLQRALFESINLL